MTVNTALVQAPAVTEWTTMPVWPVPEKMSSLFGSVKSERDSSVALAAGLAKLNR